MNPSSSPETSSPLPSTSPNPTTASAYLIVEARIDDWPKFSKYCQVVPNLIKKYGGEYIVLGGEHTPLEGDWGTESSNTPTRLVVSRWPSTELCKTFWYSEEYQEAKLLREGTGDFKVMLVEGLEQQTVLER